MSIVSVEKNPEDNDGKLYTIEDLENIGKNILNFGNEIHEYLEHIEAKVENYKFGMEKRANGLEVDLHLTAFIQLNSLGTARNPPEK